MVACFTLKIMNMLISVTSEDIRGAGRTPADNPVTRAIRRYTGETWVVFGGSTAYYRNLPYRTLALPPVVHDQWQLSQKTAVWKTFEFELDFSPPPEKSEAERRRFERRKSPRFGFDRRRSDRRNRERRRKERRGD
jgi:hypothetical protein